MLKDKLNTINAKLESFLSTSECPCAVVLANQVSPIPPYPYVAYTLTQARSEHGGTYGIDENGNRTMEFDSVISYTVQSDDEDEAVFLAVKAAAWFQEIGTTFFSDNDVYIKRVGAVTNRDNLISVQYEYRDGFDVTFTTVEKLEASEFDDDGYIETAVPQYYEK